MIAYLAFGVAFGLLVLAFALYVLAYRLATDAADLARQLAAPCAARPDPEPMLTAPGDAFGVPGYRYEP